MQRLVASEARIAEREDPLGPHQALATSNALMEAAGRIYEAPLYIIDMPNMKLLDLRTLARRLQGRAGRQDHLRRLPDPGHPREHRTCPGGSRSPSISRSLKALARELRIPVVALSQLQARGGRQAADPRGPPGIGLDRAGRRPDPLPPPRPRGRTRPEEERSPPIETELIVAKQRNGPVGHGPGSPSCPPYTRFESIDKHRRAVHYP
ncbi:MAG: DnaB-like helicase C-terminal domain-containing protein [Desulfomicrobium escambiense]|nr:DnaB-like helicase C-terminal domain-containing protein [Desulfomicrobium escambiense]